MANDKLQLVSLPEAVFFQEGPGLRKWQWTDSGMKVINVKNIKPNGSVDTSNSLRHISIDEFNKKYSHFAIEDNDIVVASSGNTYGKVGRIKSSHLPLMMNTSVIRFHSANPKLLDDGYLYAFLRSPVFRNQVEQYVTGSAQPNFGPSHLKLMHLPLPTLSRQQEIASILSAYDDLIENNTRRIRILEEMAQSLYREWFVHFRFPGNEKVKLVNSPRGKIPEGWESAKLSEIAQVNASSIKRGEDPEEINYIDIASVSMGYIEKTEALSFIDAPGRARRKVKHGDIIWSTVRPNRRSFSIILDPLSNLIVSTGFAVITALEVPFTYLYQATTTEEFVSYLSNHAKGSAYPAVTAADFMNFNVLLPSQVILEAYNKIVEPLFILKQNKLNKNANLRNTRDLLLPKLITGEVEASNLREDAI